MDIAIGIITNNRKSELYRLLKKLRKQLTSKDHVFIIENGSQLIENTALIDILGKNYTYSRVNACTTGLARNKIFKKVKNSYRILSFIDDDCVPADNWLNAIRVYFRKFKNAPVLQGKVTSVPKNNIYAATTSILYQTWLNKNKYEQSKLKVIDTKNVSINLKYFRKEHNLFSPNAHLIDDLDLAYKLALKKIPIYYSPNVVVRHFERITLSSFAQQRYRLSLLFQKINLKSDRYFQTVTINTRLKSILAIRKQPLSNRLLMILILIFTYLRVSSALFINLIKSSLYKN